jgi:hypothetical protein
MGYRTPGDLAFSVDVLSRAIHTCYDQGAWINRLGPGATLSRHPERHEAIVEGRRLAMQRRTLLVVHGEDGAVEFREDHRD